MRKYLFQICIVYVVTFFIEGWFVQEIKFKFGLSRKFDFYKSLVWVKIFSFSLF